VFTIVFYALAAIALLASVFADRGKTKTALLLERLTAPEPSAERA
jgi:hypothetical protein